MAATASVPTPARSRGSTCSTLSPPAGLGVACGGLRNARLKEWEAFQLCDDSVFVLGAVYTKSISCCRCWSSTNAATIRRWEKRGRVEGFNLTDNRVRDPQRHNENAVWLGDRLSGFPPSTWNGRAARGYLVGARRRRVRSGRRAIHPTVRSEMHVGPRRSLAEYYAPYGW